jgi:hypothetical protein
MVARRLLTLILAAQLAFPATVWGEAAREMRQPEPQDTARFLNKIEQLMQGNGAKLQQLMKFDRAQMQKKIKDGALAAARGSVNSLGHNTQTLILLWLLSGMEAIRQQEKFRPITADEKIRDPKNTLEHLANWWDLGLRSGSHMINSLDLAASMVGGGVVAGAFAPALGVLNQLVEGNATRPFIAKLFTGGTASFITFVGWEAGHRVIEEGIWLLDEKDIPIAKELKFAELMIGNGTPEERAVFVKLLGKVWEILSWAQPEVSEAWLYNTWRLNIATGDFVAMVTSMTVAGVAAGTILPGPGWLTGGIGGMVGGIIAVFFIPKGWKRRGTDAIRRMRINTGYSRMHVNEQELKRIDRLLGDSQFGLDQKNKLRRAELLLKERRGYRDDIGTALMEQAHDALLTMQESEFTLKLIEARQGEVACVMKKHEMLTLNELFAMQNDPDVQTLKSEALAEMADGRKRFKYYMNELLEVQRKEVGVFGPLGYSLQHAAHPLQPLYAKQVKNLETIHITVRQLYAGLMPEMLKEMGLENMPADDLGKIAAGAPALFTLLYMRGFSEAYILED